MIAAVVFALAAIVSCRKEGVPFFRGSYGYVTSGQLTLSYEEGDLSMTRECQIPRERGILRIEPKGGDAVVTMSSIGGDAVVFDAVVDGTDIELKPAERNVTLTVGGDVVNVSMFVSGKGYKTNGLLVLDLTYKSVPFTAGIDGNVYTVKSSKVSCIANLQE